MALSILLAKKILSMLLMAIVGYLVVKTGLLKSKDKDVLNVLCLYAIAPCVVITSYQMELTPDKLQGLIITLVGAVVVHILFILLAALLKKPLKLSNVEQAALILSNAGNLILPLVSSVLGPDAVFYACSYIAVQTVLAWTYMISLISDGELASDPVKILKNPNIIAIFIGLALFLCHITLPSVITDTLNSIGSMIGPLAMVITGMIIAELDLKVLFLPVRSYLISFGRLIVFPLLFILLVRLSGITFASELARSALLITLLAASAPVASNVVLFSLLCGKNTQQASSVNVMSLLFCVVTMPLMVLIYQIVC